MTQAFFRFLPIGNILRMFLAFVTATPLVAQEYIAKVEHYSVEQGLSHRQVNAMLQDSRGFVWVGTPNGLNRFDGYSFRQYTKEKDGLRFNYIQEIAEDADGWLWLVESEQKSMCLFHPERGAVLSLEEKFGKTAPWFAGRKFNYKILSDDDGAVWLASLNGDTLYRYHPASGVRPVIVEGGYGKIHPIRFSMDKTMWLYTENNIILEINREGKVLHRLENAWPYGDWSITDNGLLVSSRTPAGAEHFVLYDPHGNELPYYPPVSARPYPAFIIPFDGKGIFAIHDRLIDAQGRTLAQWEFAQHDSNNFLWRAYFKDRAGRHWLGDDFGFYILQIKKNHFQHYFYNKDAKIGLGNSIRGILLTPGKLYANLENSGLFELDLRSSQIRHVAAAGSGWGNYALALTQSGAILSGREKALIRLSPDAQSAERIPTTFSPWAFWQEPSGKIWIGSSSGGLFTLAPGAATPEPFTQYNGFNALTSGLILHIWQDPSGILWVCSSNGFYKVHPQKGVLARYWNGSRGEYFLPAENFLHFQLDAAGVFWFATANGLVRSGSRIGSDGSRAPAWDEKTGKLFNRANSLPNDFIYAVYEDKLGNIWMPTDNGIVCMNKKSEAIKAYYLSDGITNAEFNRKAHFQAPDGTLYFGGLNGINAFNPNDFEQIADTLSEAPLALTAFQQFDGKRNRLVDLTGELLHSRTITLRPDDRFFNLELSLLSFEKPRLIQYAWKIDGLDKSWHYQKERQINFGGLRYGTYTLHIKAQAADGQWSRKELTFTVRVLRPWYLQTWFLLLLALLLGAGIRFYIRRRSRQHILEQKKLEGLVIKATERIEQDKRTIEKQAEELRHLDEVKSRFFANVSHELRTPLSLLLGPIGSVLKRNKQDNHDFSLLKLAQMHGRQLLQLVNQILDLSKLESGKLELHETPSPLYPLLRRIVAAFESHAEQKGIQFVFQYRAEKSLQLLLDPLKMETILNNLLSNALKFTTEGGEIQVIAENLAHSMCITVSDTGRGIHPDDLPNIFDRFYQSGQPGAPTEGGTGIGLALCRELAGIMGGSIRAESEGPGKGSRFFFEFPLREVLGKTTTGEYEAVPPGAIAETMQPLAHLLPRERPEDATILIVEDNISLRDYLQLILAPNYRIITAENGQEALTAMDAGNLPHLIISDIMMPVMDGFQLVEQLKNDTRYRPIPVIMLTARADIQDKLHALRIGVDDYLLKPFEEEELLVRIDTLLLRYRERLQWAPAEEEPEAGAPHSENEMAWLETLESLVVAEAQNDLLSVAWIADRLHLSERQFQRRLKKLTGLSPNAYLNEVRLQEARRLLEAGKVQAVKELAWAMSFRNEKYFARIFRERFGKNPSELLR